MSSAIRPRRFAGAALAVAIAFTVIHCLFQLTWTIQRRTPMAVKQWFDLRHDYSLPSWFGFCCFGAAGLLCARWGWCARATGPLLTGALFVFLMVDDLLMLHERLGGLAADALRGTGMYAWVIVIGVPLGAAGLLAWRSCWRALAGDRVGQLRLLLGFAALGGSMGIEAFEQRIGRSGLQWRQFDLLLYTQVVEEFLEFVGPILVAWSAAVATANVGRPVVAGPGTQSVRTGLSA